MVVNTERGMVLIGTAPFLFMSGRFYENDGFCNKRALSLLKNQRNIDKQCGLHLNTRRRTDCPRGVEIF